MPVTYNEVTREEIESATDVFLKCGERFAAALQTMMQNEMQTVWLPWTSATRRYIDLVRMLGTQALLEAEDQAALKRAGRTPRFEQQKKASRYQADRRARQSKPDVTSHGTASAPAASSAPQPPARSPAVPIGEDLISREDGKSGSGRGSAESVGGEGEAQSSAFLPASPKKRKERQ